MIVEMREFGRSLVTRVAGRLAYDRIAPLVSTAEGVVTFDFTGVDTVTNSFADEVFGHLVFDEGMEWMRSHTKFVGIDPFFARVVRSAMDLRESQRRVPA